MVATPTYEEARNALKALQSSSAHHYYYGSLLLPRECRLARFGVNRLLQRVAFVARRKRRGSLWFPRLLCLTVKEYFCSLLLFENQKGSSRSNDGRPTLCVDVTARIFCSFLAVPRQRQPGLVCEPLQGGTPPHVRWYPP